MGCNQQRVVCRTLSFAYKPKPTPPAATGGRASPTAPTPCRRSCASFDSLRPLTSFIATRLWTTMRSRRRRWRAAIRRASNALGTPRREPSTSWRPPRWASRSCPVRHLEDWDQSSATTPGQIKMRKPRHVQPEATNAGSKIRTSEGPPSPDTPLQSGRDGPGKQAFAAQSNNVPTITAQGASRWPPAALLCAPIRSLPPLALGPLRPPPA